ncbi:scoloptoxin SSD14-like isoform X2 [Rhipicephalus microplus]|uniref:scoloptoxin SSD14-like isoform X2 n=1 Tax=Rhipicephalus microplus TaxID=6941 RepID=UPI003F6C1E2E
MAPKMTSSWTERTSSLAASSAIKLFLIFAITAADDSEVPDSVSTLIDTCPIGKGTAQPRANASSSFMGNYSQWGITTDAAQCENVSRHIYEQNGSTIDAAIATLLCMGVVIPHSMGIGGGFIATIYNESAKEARVLIARETAPANATEEMFGENKTASIRGGLAVAVPGELRGYKALHDEYGRLPWRHLFNKSILLARCGFPIGFHLAMALKYGQTVNSSLANETRRAFVNNITGKVLQKGEILIQEDLAKTLEGVANQGVNYFYEGDIAKELVDKVNEWGGVMTTDDLKNYTVRWEKPVNTTFQGNYTLFSVPPPGSGPVLAYILGIMDKFRSENESCLPDNITTLHRIIESFKFGYAKRAELGDMAYVNCSELVTNMTSSSFAEAAKTKINDSCTYNDPEYYGFVNESAPKDSGTAHITFYGKDGITISVSSSINYYFGSLVRTKSGILLNNQMDDFSRPGKPNIYGLAPSSANFIVPGKRPMSSMAPMVIVDAEGKVQLAMGGTGGSLITSGIALVTVRAMWQGYNIKQAIDERRLHHQLIPNVLEVEPGFPEDYIEELRKLGHVVKNRTGRFNVILGIQKNGERILANSDYRKGGAVDGE